MKLNLFSSVALFALLATAPAHANQCDDVAASNKAAVASSYDAAIAQFQKLYDGGARVIELDIDGEGPSEKQEYRIDKLIEILATNRDGKYSEINSDMPGCYDALKTAKNAEEVAKISMVMDPIGMIGAGLVDKQLADLGLGPNNDLRGALTLFADPTAAAAELIANPDEVLKKFIHKPQNIILAPWILF